MPNEALRLGLVSEVVDADQLEARNDGARDRTREWSAGVDAAAEALGLQRRGTVVRTGARRNRVEDRDPRPSPRCARRRRRDFATNAPPSFNAWLDTTQAEDDGRTRRLRRRRTRHRADHDRARRQDERAERGRHSGSARRVAAFRRQRRKGRGPRRRRRTRVLGGRRHQGRPSRNVAGRAERRRRVVQARHRGGARLVHRRRVRDRADVRSRRRRRKHRVQISRGTGRLHRRPDRQRGRRGCRTRSRWNSCCSARTSPRSALTTSAWSIAVVPNGTQREAALRVRADPRALGAARRADAETLYARDVERESRRSGGARSQQLLRVRDSEDGAEGRRAFGEKRPPTFKGR